MGRLALGFTLPAIPFALTDVVTASIIAGVFSVLNTMLNLHVIRIASSTKRDFQQVKETAVESKDEIKQLVSDNTAWDGKERRKN